AEQRRHPADHRGGRERPAGAGPEIYLRRRQGGPGAGRFRRARRARPAGAACSYHRRPRRRAPDPGPGSRRSPQITNQKESSMQLGMIGLGRMGGNIVRRLMRDGHSCVVYDRSEDAVKGLAGEGATPSKDLADFVKKLDHPKNVWVMLPAGKITHDTIVELSQLLGKGDTVIDGGNTNYHDDITHSDLLKPKGITFLDVGTS